VRDRGPSQDVEGLAEGRIDHVGAEHFFLDGVEH
jgi:hypothetical protein